MVVKTHCTGLAVTGVHVGTTNVRRYFPKSIEVIELQLDHLRIQCGLAPDFWRDQRRFTIPGSAPGSSPSFFIPSRIKTQFPSPMIPSGKNSFRLQILHWHDEPKDRLASDQLLEHRPPRRGIPLAKSGAPLLCAPALRAAWGAEVDKLGMP